MGAKSRYIYANKNPNQGRDRLRAERVKYVLSSKGQQAVIKDGYYPVSKTLVDEDLRALGL